MTYVREDTALITVEGDPIPWDSLAGGETVLEGPLRSYKPLHLRRIRSDSNVGYLAKHVAAIGRATKVTIAHLDATRRPTGIGLRFDGAIIEVIPAMLDANSMRLAMDELVVEPSRTLCVTDIPQERPSFTKTPTVRPNHLTRDEAAELCGQIGVEVNSSLAGILKAWYPGEDTCTVVLNDGGEATLPRTIVTRIQNLRGDE